MLSPEDFVKEWLKSYKLGETQTDLCKRLGLDRAMVSGRKVYYKKLGIKLPNLRPAPRGRGDPINIDSLNALIDTTQ